MENSDYRKLEEIVGGKLVAGGIYTDRVNNPDDDQGYDLKSNPHRIIGPVDTIDLLEECLRMNSTTMGIILGRVPLHELREKDRRIVQQTIEWEKRTNQSI